MALPAFLLKAKNAASKVKAAKEVKDAVSSDSEEEVKKGLGFAAKGIMASGCGFAIVIGLLFSVILLVAVNAFGAIELLMGVDPAYNKSGNSDDAISAYLDWAIKIAEDDSHGYSQCARTGPDYDCSSLVWYALVEGAGVDPADLGGYAFATFTMPETLKAVGFTEYKFTGYDDLQPGDILVIRTQHTEIYVGDGKTVGAHIAETGGVCGATGDQTGNEISVAASTRMDWETYYRLETVNENFDAYYNDNNNINGNGAVDLNYDFEEAVRVGKRGRLSTNVSADLKNTRFKNKKGFNNYAASKVKAAGYGTRAGVVAFAMTMAVDYPKATGAKLRYGRNTNTAAQGGGKQRADTVGLKKDRFYQDCSQFVGWALYNGGYKIPKDIILYGGTPGVKLMDAWAKKNHYNVPLKNGKAGDWLIHYKPNVYQHIQLIVGRYSGGYYTAEETGGFPKGYLRISKHSFSELKKKNYYVINMDKYYGNSRNVR